MYATLIKNIRITIVALALIASATVLPEQTQACGANNAAATLDRQAANSGYCTAGPKLLPGG